MKLLRQFSIVLIFCFVGQAISSIFKLAIPGNVVGMLLLVLFLCSGIIKVEFIEEVSNFLLDHLSFLFVPAGVGIMASVAAIKGCWQYLLIIVVVSTFIAMSVTALTVKLFKRS